MVATHRGVGSIAVLTVGFFALSGPGVSLGTGGALLAVSALAATGAFLVAASTWGRANAEKKARGLALADAEGLMRMDTDRG
jgi:hypothetical protein